jgi:hypothetical protein
MTVRRPSQVACASVRWRTLRRSAHCPDGRALFRARYPDPHRIQTLAAALLVNRTVVLITHDPMEACRLSHRLLVLSPLPAGLTTRITFPACRRARRMIRCYWPARRHCCNNYEGWWMSAKLFRAAVVFCGLLLLWWLATRSGIPAFLLPSPGGGGKQPVG